MIEGSKDVAVGWKEEEKKEDCLKHHASISYAVVSDMKQREDWRGGFRWWLICCSIDQSLSCLEHVMRREVTDPESSRLTYAFVTWNEGAISEEYRHCINNRLINENCLAGRGTTADMWRTLQSLNWSMLSPYYIYIGEHWHFVAVSSPTSSKWVDSQDSDDKDTFRPCHSSTHPHHAYQFFKASRERHSIYMWPRETYAHVYMYMYFTDHRKH